MPDCVKGTRSRKWFFLSDIWRLRQYLSLWHFAYDLCFSYNPAGRWTSRHQLSLNSKTDDFTREDLLAVAQSVGLRDANHIIEEVRASVAAWPDVAKDCGVRREHLEAIGKTLLLEI